MIKTDGYCAGCIFYKANMTAYLNGFPNTICANTLICEKAYKYGAEHTDEFMKNESIKKMDDVILRLEALERFPVRERERIINDPVRERKFRRIQICQAVSTLLLAIGTIIHIIV